MPFKCNPQRYTAAEEKSSKSNNDAAAGEDEGDEGELDEHEVGLCTLN